MRVALVFIVVLSRGIDPEEAPDLPAPGIEAESRGPLTCLHVGRWWCFLL